MTPKVLPLFSTPFATQRWSDCDGLNQALRQDILSRRIGEASIGRSTVNGWHSGLTLLQEEVACFAELRGRLTDFAVGIMRQFATQELNPADIELEGWANVLDTGGYNSLHSHPNAEWAGVYYVSSAASTNDTGEFAGKLELFDPRPGAALHYREGSNLYGRFLLDPKPGQVVLFPGWVQHQVHPYSGAEPRVSIAFNVMMR